MTDMNKVLGQLLGSGAVGGFAGGLAARLNIPPDLAETPRRQVRAHLETAPQNRQ
jgi:hypothetical protein